MKINLENYSLVLGQLLSNAISLPVLIQDYNEEIKHINERWFLQDKDKQRLDTLFEARRKALKFTASAVQLIAASFASFGLIESKLDPDSYTDTTEKQSLFGLLQKHTINYSKMFSQPIPIENCPLATEIINSSLILVNELYKEKLIVNKLGIEYTLEFLNDLEEYVAELQSNPNKASSNINLQAPSQIGMFTPIAKKLDAPNPSQSSYLKLTKM